MQPSIIIGLLICTACALSVDAARSRLVILLSDASKNRYLIEPEASASNVQPVPYQAPEKYQITRRSYTGFSRRQQTDPDDYYQPNEYQPLPRRLPQSQLDSLEDTPQYDIISTRDSSRDREFDRDLEKLLIESKQQQINHDQRYPSAPPSRKSPLTSGLQQEYYTPTRTASRRPASAAPERRQPNPHPDYYAPSRKPSSVQDYYANTPSRRPSSAHTEQYLKEVEPVTKTTYVPRQRTVSNYQQQQQQQQQQQYLEAEEPITRAPRGRNLVYQQLQQQQQQQQLLEAQELEPVPKSADLNIPRGRQLSYQPLENSELESIKPTYVSRGRNANYHTVQVIDNQEENVDEDEAPLPKVQPEATQPRTTQRTPQRIRQRQRQVIPQKSQPVEYQQPSQETRDTQEYPQQQYLYVMTPQYANSQRQAQEAAVRDRDRQSATPKYQDNAVLRTLYVNPQYAKQQSLQAKSPQVFPSRSSIYVSQTSTNGHKKNRGQPQPSPPPHEEDAPVVKIPNNGRRVRPLSQEELQNLIQSGAYKATLITDVDEDEQIPSNSRQSTYGDLPQKSSARDRVTYLIRQRQ